MSLKKEFSSKRVSIIYGKRRARSNYFGSDLNFIGIKFFLPRLLFSLLQAFKAARGIPMARLVAIAVFNEMRREDAFKLKLKAETPYKHGTYTTEAATIYKFLSDNFGGMAKDLLYMSHTHLGIIDDERFLHGITDLVESGLCEEIHHVEGSDATWIQIKNFKTKEPFGIKRILSK